MLNFIGELISKDFQAYLEIGLITGIIVVVLGKAFGCQIRSRESAIGFLIMVSYSLSCHVFTSLIFGRPL